MTQTTTEIRLTVPGIARPQGSKVPMGRAKSGRILMVEASKHVGPWRERVALAAQRAMNGQPPIDAPVQLTLRVYLPRPKGHYGTGRNSGTLKPSAPAYPQGPPDLSKLVRAVEDAITRIVISDDARICSLGGTCKLYGDMPMAEIVVAPL